MRKHTLRLLSALLLPCLLLTGCWKEDLPEEAPGDLFPIQEEEPGEPEDDTALPTSFSLPYVPEQTLDPLTCPDGMQQVVGSLLYEGLFRLNHSFTPQPLLCESYTYQPENNTYVLNLRPGVKFSDGSPLTGSDVKATLNRAKKSPRYQARLSQVSRITATESTVTITLYGPNAAFPALLDIPILKGGAQYAPIGTGPYLLSSDNALPCLVASQTWWQGDRQPVERISLVEASDWNTMLYRFSSHEVQLITADLIGDETISTTGSINFQDTDTTILQYIGCNTRRAPLDNAAFRSALWKGFNRTTVVNAFLSGHGKPAQFPVSAVSPLYPAELENRYSSEVFAAALAESGYRPSRPLTLLVNAENPFKISVANFIAKSFSSAGVSVTVKALPWEAYREALAAGNFDLYYGEVRLTADWNAAALLATGGSLNYGGWSDPETDRLISAYIASADLTTMTALCRHLRDQAPILPVCFSATSVLSQSKVLEGLTPTDSEPFYDLQNCTIHLRK